MRQQSKRRRWRQLQGRLRHPSSSRCCPSCLSSSPSPRSRPHGRLRIRRGCRHSRHHGCHHNQHRDHRRTRRRRTHGHVCHHYRRFRGNDQSPGLPTASGPWTGLRNTSADTGHPTGESSPGEWVACLAGADKTAPRTAAGEEPSSPAVPGGCGRHIVPGERIAEGDTVAGEDNLARCQFEVCGEIVVRHGE